MLAKEIKQIAGCNWKAILLFELLYRLLTLPAWLKVLDRGLQLALSWAGYSYLTAENIGSFFLRPGTIAVVCAVGAVGALILLLETASLITAFEGAASYQKLTPLHMLWGGLQKAGRELERRHWRLGLVLLIQYFFANLLFFLRAATHIRPVNFILDELGSRPGALAVLAAGLAVVLALSFPAWFTVYGCLAEGRGYRDSRSYSSLLMRGHFWRIAAGLMAGNLLSVLAVFLIYALAVFVSAVCVVGGSSQYLTMALFLSVADKLEVLALFAGSIVVQLGHCTVLGSLYRRYGYGRLQLEGAAAEYPAPGSFRRRMLGICLAIVLCTGAFSAYDIARHGSALTDEMVTDMEITAHRGSSMTAPENTVPAVLAAIDELADRIEIDVQMTADGVVVLAHDANLKRVAGVNQAIGDLTYQELEELDAGGWFSDEFQGTKIPTLAEVLELCQDRVDLNIELKHTGRDCALPEAVTALIREYGMEEQCVVTSASLSCLELVKALEPDIRTGYIIAAAYGDFYSDEAVDFISLRSSFVSRRLVERIHEQGKAIYAWTVNSASEMERMMLLQVDGIITDWPVRARETIYQEEAADSVIECVKLMFRR